MLRVRTTVAGWTAGPGVMTSYFVAAVENQSVAQAVANRVQAALGNLSGVAPSGITWTVQPQVDQLDAVTGEMISAFIVTAPAVVNAGAGQTVFAPPQCAALIRLRTGVFDGGRAIAGRVFVSPLQGSAVDATGTLSSTQTGQVLAFAQALLGTVDLEPILSVWRRPRLADSTVTPPIVARAGRTANVVGVTVADKLATLNSRRD